MYTWKNDEMIPSDWSGQNQNLIIIKTAQTCGNYLPWSKILSKLFTWSLYLLIEEMHKSPPTESQGKYYYVKSTLIQTRGENSRLSHPPLSPLPSAFHLLYIKHRMVGRQQHPVDCEHCLGVSLATNRGQLVCRLYCNKLWAFIWSA